MEATFRGFHLTTDQKMMKNFSLKKDEKKTTQKRGSTLTINHLMNHVKNYRYRIGKTKVKALTSNYQLGKNWKTIWLRAKWYREDRRL
jgi:hypothetical protein